jgi:hypothetical protein
MVFLSSCFSAKKTMTTNTNDPNFLIQYISELESQDKITNSPLLVIDGFTTNYAEYKENSRQLSESDIKQIDYLSKDSETAINIYGERAKGGVLLIMTNKIPVESAQTIDDSKVLILLDEKQISKKELEKLNPENIESIEVIKDKAEVMKYTKDNYDGVVIINMKKNIIDK